MSEAAQARERAVRRLDAALDALEAAVERNRANARRTSALDAEVQALSQDRSRLADELDHARARTRRLEAATAQADERLEAAIASIGGLLERDRVS